MSDLDQSGGVWAVAITFTILTWTTLLLRIYVRAGKNGKFGYDDWAAIVAQILFTAYLVCQFGGVIYGTGRRLSILNYSDATIALKFWFMCEVWYTLAGTACKVSICLALLRVTIIRWQIWTIYGLMLWSVGLGLAFFLGILFQCIPMDDWWDLDPAHKRCLPLHIITALVYAISVVNVLCDWALGLFPFVIVKDLAIPWAQKTQVAGVLAFGAVASIATCIRIAYLPTLDNTYAGWNGDFLYDTTPIAILATVEYGVAITAMCLATLRPLVKRIFGTSSAYASGGARGSQSISSVDSSAYCSHGGPPTELTSFHKARNNALAIIDADDDDLPTEQHADACFRTPPPPFSC